MAKTASSLRWWRRKTSNGMGILGAGETGRRGVIPCIPPLTRPDTLAMPLVRKEAGSDHGRPTFIVSGFSPRATSNGPPTPLPQGRDGSTEAVVMEEDRQEDTVARKITQTTTTENGKA